MVHTCYPSTWEGKSKSLQIQGQPFLDIKCKASLTMRMSSKTKKQKNKNRGLKEVKTERIEELRIGTKKKLSASTRCPAGKSHLQDSSQADAYD